MPWSLKRYYGTGALHFITFSCHNREPVLGSLDRRNLFLSVLEEMRCRYRFAVVGYVVMPEHVHLLMSEPRIADPSRVIQALKLSFARKLLYPGCPISRASCAREVGILNGPKSHWLWMSRFYDFNVWSQRKETEKLKYMHRNPVVRGLVARPEDWAWSSFRSYATGEPGLVKINDWSWWEREIQTKVS